MYTPVKDMFNYTYFNIVFFIFTSPSVNNNTNHCRSTISYIKKLSCTGIVAIRNRCYLAARYILSCLFRP